MIGGPVTAIEGVTLGATIAEVAALAEGAGWKHNTRPDHPNQSVVILVGAGVVKRFKLKFEDSRLIVLEVEYREPDPDRRQRFEGLPLHREKDGWWYADAERTVLAYVQADGAMIRLMHTGMARDRREVEAMYRTLLGVE